MPNAAQRPQDRRPDGRTDDRGAGRAAADQSHQPVHGVARALEEALRRGRQRRPIRRNRPSRPGMRSRATPPAPGRGRWTSFVPRERLELVKNDDYWDPARRPKVDRLVLLPMPEANARTAALLSGQVDWIENPAPDALPQIKQRGFVDLPERAAACLAVAVQPHRGLALERHPRAQGRQPLRRPRRHEGRSARRPDGAGDRHLRARPSVARQSEIPDQVRSERGAQADGRSRLLEGQAAQGEDPDLGLGLRPDAAAADERVRPAEPRRVLLRRRARRDRMEHAVHQLAQGRQGRVGARRRTPPT